MTKYLTSRAIAAFYRKARKLAGDYQPMQPRNENGERIIDGRRYVVLRNVCSILAVYRVRNNGMLRAMKRWPAEIE
jgi:hypothetical protein